MPNAIPVGYEKSPAIKLVISQGWSFEPPNSGGQIAVETCPFCGKGDSKFYIGVCTNEDIEAGSSRDGLYFCHKCQTTGNLRTLQEKLGLRIPGVDSRREWSGSSKTDKPDELPDVNLCHAALLADAEALDYLQNVRGFSKEIIERQKLGLKEKVYFRKAGESHAIVIPYLSVEGNITFAKYRTLPPAEKDFSAPTGWDAGLYNSPALNDDTKEIIFVEGEYDCIALLSNGIENVVGVPGAGVKKAEWIEALDRINPQIYILFDPDQAGTKGSQELASRIGIERCLKIVLPKGTKDPNEFFQKGGTTEEFLELKKKAVQFDVTGVTPSKNALQQLMDELDGKNDLAPTYITPWPKLNKLVGFEDGDVIDILAPEKVGKTTLALNLIDHMVDKYGEDGLFVCLEMTQARLARKWVAMTTGFEDKITEPGTPEAKAKLVELKEACVKAMELQRSREADLYFAYPTAWQDNPESVFKLIRDCIRRYNVKWVVFDNLQKFCDESLKQQNHRTVYLSQLSKRFATIAKDYKVKMVRILQPKRIEKGSIISSNDTDGSSQVAKDCDCMITAWRKPVESTRSAYAEEQEEGKESEMSFEPIMRLSVALTRYSGGGSCYVMYDGARSQVRSIVDQKPKPQQHFNNILPMESGEQIKVLTEDISL